jgi:hypothetical protein
LERGCSFFYKIELERKGLVSGTMNLKMTDFMIDGQLVYHISEEGTWIGQYTEKYQGILYNGTVYLSLSSFAFAHTGKYVNGWRECKIEVNGEMVQASELKHVLSFHLE